MQRDESNTIAAVTPWKTPTTGSDDYVQMLSHAGSA